MAPNRSRMLPARLSQSLILTKISENRVTMILGETGSGKSSQIPQMLLEQNMGPILCTQPRRLAVVAIAKMVAEERGCVLGEEVGYHIGQMNHTSPGSKLVFETAGVLLEEIKSKGPRAFSRYKVVILDEVHERSVESELVLCSAKLLLAKNKNLRLVLMSATADFQAYENYFADLGPGETFDKVAIPTVIQNQLFRCRVHFLEQTVDILGRQRDHLSLLMTLTTRPYPAEGHTTGIGTGTQRLIRDLIGYIHQSEAADPGKSILVFLPTYRSLEEQWNLLHESGLDLRLYVLHSSIDIDQSLEAMEACTSVRKVILATDVAESSITVPGAAFVIDSCRNLELFWRNESKSEATRLVWESISQAEQRKGRTGRTCDGTVYRVVPRVVYQSFAKFEIPAMKLVSLREQVLLLACASTRALNDSTVFLQKCMNPPRVETVHNALEALVALKALQRDSRSRYQPTLYGRLLAALPLSLVGATLVVEGSEREHLYESAVLGALMDASPLPINQPFGTDVDHTLKYYFKEHGGRVNRSSALVANLCAFEFWQCTFQDDRRLQALLQGEPMDVRTMEKEWCMRHHLSASALHMVNETLNVVMEVMHHFRPHSVSLYSGPPSYCKADHFRHSCPEASAECPCNPYVSNGCFHEVKAEKEFDEVIVEAQSRCKQINAPKTLDYDGTTQCVYYGRGSCNKGDSCQFSHSVHSRPPVCSYFESGSGCRFGASCRYLHDSLSHSVKVEFGMDVFSFERVCRVEENFRGRILLLGEDTMSYMAKLKDWVDPCIIWAGCMDTAEEALEKNPKLQHALPGTQVIWNLIPAHFTLPRASSTELGLAWDEITNIIFNFPFRSLFKTSKEAEPKVFIREFLKFIAKTQIDCRRFAGLTIQLTMTTRDYALWQVERAARESFFFLEHSYVLDPSFFTDLSALVEDEFPPEKLVTYFFRLSARVCSQAPLLR